MANEENFQSCLTKQKDLLKHFSTLFSAEDVYNKIIEFGRASTGLKNEHKIEENQVSGCQSTMYLQTFAKEGKVYFESDSDALISSGLAYLLCCVYSGESPETILKCPPDYLKELKLEEKLSANRANGLFSIHLRMKQEALKYLLNPKNH
jgi:cysteine desulfuration protein SufE